MLKLFLPIMSDIKWFWRVHTGGCVKATLRVPDQLNPKEIQLDMTFLEANNIFIPYICPYTPVNRYTNTTRNKLRG
jgi:hypothetical protein